MDSLLGQDDEAEGLALAAGCAVRVAAAGSWTADGLRPEDVVLQLPPGQRLAAADAVRRVRAAFADAGCRLLYAPHEQADGRLSATEPAQPGDAGNPDDTLNACLQFSALSAFDGAVNATRREVRHRAHRKA